MEYSKTIAPSGNAAVISTIALPPNEAVSNEVIYLTPQQLIERWNHSHTLKTLANWRSIGYGPRYIKIGGRVLYPLEDVKAWEARQR